jgi:hypothetical protein
MLVRGTRRRWGVCTAGTMSALPRLSVRVVLLLSVLAVARASAAQDPPPRIGPIALDLHGTLPGFPSADQQLAESRGLVVAELPGRGLGVHGAFHVYPFRVSIITFGLGVDLTAARAHRGPRPLSQTETSRAVTETFFHAAPEISFNFGDGNGWSYLSGGIGPALWAVVPDGALKQPPDLERLQTINYGGGARWFNWRHVAFSIDIRFYAINPAAPLPGLPTSPRTTLIFFGGGISLK